MTDPVGDREQWPCDAEDSFASQPDCVVVSGVTHGTGGLYALLGDELLQLDDKASVGLFFQDGDLLRLLHSEDPDQRHAWLLTYDDRGLRSQHRLDGVVEPHDVACDGENIAVVSTGTNEVLWFDRVGVRQKSWRAPGTGEGDAWHLNSLWRHDGGMAVSAFGRFTGHREWDHQEGTTGEVIDVASGATMVAGLQRPHNPRLVDGQWWVCNSRRGEVLRYGVDGGVDVVSVGGWTRGLLIDRDRVYVGISAHRLAADAGASSEIVVLDRRSLHVLSRVPCPSREVYDIVMVPFQVAVGAHALSLASGVPFASVISQASLGEPGSTCSLRFTYRQPRLVSRSKDFWLSCDVMNDGQAMLSSALPEPIALSYHWQRLDTSADDPWVEPLRTALPAPLAPGQRTPAQLRITPPGEAGFYRFRLTAVREHVAWFEPSGPTSPDRVAVV